MWAEGRAGDGLRDGWKAQENEGKLICGTRRKDFPGTKRAPAFHSFIQTVNSAELPLAAWGLITGDVFRPRHKRC